VRGDAVRSSVTQAFDAAFDVILSADGCDASTRPQRLVLPLDLDSSGGATPVPFVESFEVASGFGAFTPMSLDTGLNTVALSDGMRCQPNDPSDPHSPSFRDGECFLGFTDSAQNQFDWHVHGTPSPDGGRAYLGTRSLHFGVHPGAASMDTTRLSQLDAIRTTNPINLPASQDIELTFKHQASMADSRMEMAARGETRDRAVVQAQLADASGNPVGSWTTLEPYFNGYDERAALSTQGCTFDPVDDGNDENSVFGATGGPKLGPSSTCTPGFSFGQVGDTDYRDPFDGARTGNVSGPGLPGSVGNGTWIESRIGLSEYRGRRIRIRFLASTHKDGEVVTYNDAGGSPNESGDDGWYIDDVRVDAALTTPVTLAVDTKSVVPLNACGTNCSLVTAALSATPSASSAPGKPVVLSAAASAADTCLNGALEYQFWLNANHNAVVGDAGDVLLRDFTWDPTFNDAPNPPGLLSGDGSVPYGVVVRCSTARSCRNATTLTVFVSCPSTGVGNVTFTQSVKFSTKTTLSWPTSQSVDVLRGNLSQVRSGATFTGSVQACLLNNVATNSVTDASTPVVGGATYYLVGSAARTYCNDVLSWSSGSPKERAGRDSSLAADPNTCP
jgi:hypothetical protein